MASMQPWCGSKYAMGPELGRGGMATVHFGLLVGDLGFGRVVAIKRIHPRLAEDIEMVEHLRDEARVAARIRHPNVVSVLDVVAVGREVGIVLDYVDGESLSALLKRSRARGEPIAVSIGIALAIDVLHGLHAAHVAKDERGELLHVVHRDISPQNVLVGIDGIARVLDFGIAKAKNRSQITRDGAVKGKLAYMAPEQLGGDVSEQTDVYALGLVLWELLVGFGPFAGSTTDAELVALVLRGVTAPPSKERPAVTAAIDEIVLRAVAPEPSDRFATAIEMAQALERTGLAAARTEVAAFVADLAAESLAARRAIVEAIEARPPLASPPSAPVHAVVAPSDDATTVQAVVDPIRHEPAAPRRAYQRPLVLVGLLASVAAALVLAPRWSANAAPSKVQGAPLASAAASSTAAVEPNASAANALLGVPDASAAPATSTRTVPTPRPAPSARPSAPSTVRKTTPAALDCKVPYTVDADGSYRYRRECFPQ